MTNKKAENDLNSFKRRNADPAYRDKRTKSYNKWRADNPEAVKRFQETASENRRKKMKDDPDYREKVQERAREAEALRREKERLGGPDGWRVLVRMTGESRAKAIAAFAESDGFIQGIRRVKGRTDEPHVFDSQEIAQNFAERLFAQFPDKVEVARAEVN